MSSLDFAAPKSSTVLGNFRGLITYGRPAWIVARTSGLSRTPDEMSRLGLRGRSNARGNNLGRHAICSAGTVDTILQKAIA